VIQKLFRQVTNGIHRTGYNGATGSTHTENQFILTMHIRYPIIALLMLFTSTGVLGQSGLAVRGFCIAAPSAARLGDFVKFIDEELDPRGVNTLVLRGDHNYAFKSRPELRSDNPLSQKDVKQVVAVCRKHEIRIIPQINLLGHQSWAGQLGKLLEVYPQFDEP